MTTDQPEHSNKPLFPIAPIAPIAATLLFSLLTSLGLPIHALDLNEVMTADTSYSATQISSVDDKYVAQMEVFRDGQKVRMNMSENDQDMSMIMDIDEGSFVMLIHEMNMYQKLNSKRAQKRIQSGTLMSFTNQQELGRENVNGYDCTKYTADFEDPSGTSGTGTYWISDDKIMVRAIMNSKRRRKTTETVMNVTNIKVGDQPDELFEIPAGYSSLGFGSLLRQSQESNNTSDQVEDTSQPEQAPTEEQPEEGRGKNMRKALKGLFGRGNG